MTFPLLDNIASPQDIKEMSFDQLDELALEIRRRIIEVMSTNGGHLASSLGAVELTIALHKVFNSPKDKLLWDVGHQSYPHKLLTGRHKRFDTVRQRNGLCGFTHPKESDHDHFHAGHVGTALPLALGVAKARDFSGSDEHVIPVIGDGTLTCGMSLEALNNMSSNIGRMVVILNDNKMSISKNVGQISHLLSRILNNPIANKLYHDIDNLIAKIPGYGSTLSKGSQKFTGAMKNMVSPALFFEHFGLSYVGPVDGHDIRKLVDVFERIKNSPWPVIIHTLTEKGKGLDAAQENPTAWHGAKPFDISTEKFHPAKKSTKSFPKIFGEQMVTMAENDENIVAITPAMAAGSCLETMMDKFPSRCIDVGIAESHAVTFSGGIASDKKNKVFVSIYSSFLQRAFDNLFLDVCLQELPVVFAIDRAGIASGDGATHNGIYDIAWLNAMPNMIITQPRNGHKLREIMASAHAWGQPAAIRYPNVATSDDSTKPLTFQNIGEGEVLSKGEDILIIGAGVMCDTALAVQEELKAMGLSATVVDPIFIKPLPEKLLLDLLATHSKVVTIEEHATATGLGSILNNFLMTHGLQATTLNCGIPEAFIDHGNRAELLEELGLTPKKIVKRIQHHFSLQPQEVLS